MKYDIKSSITIQTIQHLLHDFLHLSAIQPEQLVEAKEVQKENSSSQTCVPQLSQDFLQFSLKKPTVQKPFAAQLGQLLGYPS